MRTVLTLVMALFFLAGCSQQQHFDLANYTAPKGGGWTKKVTNDAVQFSKEDAAKGDYCLITLYKALPGTGTSKENFDMAWNSLVKETMNVPVAPEMQTPTMEDGWEAQSGYAAFETGGNKGVAMLITSSGYQKMVNVLVLMNSTAYESELTGFIESISFKKPATGTTTSTAGKDKPATTIVAGSEGYAFTTTNFDDGWTSVAKDDWVEVTKGNVKVLLHYPKEGTIFPADPGPLTNAAWDILVAPRYSNLKKYRTNYVSNYERGYIATGYATDNATGKEVLLTFFRMGDTGWMEIVSTDKNSFIQQFKIDPETIYYDTDVQSLKPLVNMVTYNKFAIAAGDFRGTWTSDFTGLQQLYNVYTGNYVGMNMNQSNQTFQFGSGSTYSWEIVAVNGMVGSAKFSQTKSSGKFTVFNNWQIKFSEMEGKPKTYNAFFSCIKGARLLKLLDAAYPGSGVYTVFGMK